MEKEINFLTSKSKYYFPRTLKGKSNLGLDTQNNKSSSSCSSSCGSSPCAGGSCGGSCSSCSSDLL